MCSEGHPMVIRLGRNGRFLACSLYPEHKETRPLPGEEPEAGRVEGVGETCPECGQGTLVAQARPVRAVRRLLALPGLQVHPARPARRRPSRSPFEVACPKCGEGQLVARRARRTGSVFWGCSRYPKCDFTSSREPLGALHDADDGPVAREGESGGICLKCGAPVELPAEIVPGHEARRRRAESGGAQAGAPRRRGAGDAHDGARPSIGTKRRVDDRRQRPRAA